MRDARKEIRRAALKDALDRDGKARWDVVVDRVIADDPTQRQLDRQDLRAQVRLVVAEVNEMDIGEQRDALDGD